MNRRNSLYFILILGVEPFAVYWSGVGMMAGELRREYTEKAARLNDKWLAMSQQTDSVIDYVLVAKEIVDSRNALKQSIREDGNALMQRWAELRNLEKYGNELGPNVLYLYNKISAKHRDWSAEQVYREMVAGATRTNENVNDFAAKLEWAGYMLVGVLLLRLAWTLSRASADARLRVGGRVLGSWLMAIVGGTLGMAGAVASSHWLTDGLAFESASPRLIVWCMVGAALAASGLVALWYWIYEKFTN